MPVNTHNRSFNISLAQQFASVKCQMWIYIAHSRKKNL